MAFIIPYNKSQLFLYDPGAESYGNLKHVAFYIQQNISLQSLWLQK